MGLCLVKLGIVCIINVWDYMKIFFLNLVMSWYNRFLGKNSLVVLVLICDIKVWWLRIEDIRNVLFWYVREVKGII